MFTLFLGVVVPHVDAKEYADASGNLGFIINMKKLQPILVVDEKTEENSKNESQPSSKRIRLDNNQWFKFECPILPTKSFEKL